jgi:hypothetical protein
MIVRRRVSQLRIANDNLLKPALLAGVKKMSQYLLFSNPNYKDGLILAPRSRNLESAEKVSTKTRKRKAAASAATPEVDCETDDTASDEGAGDKGDSSGMLCEIPRLNPRANNVFGNKN